ncbi:MAG: Bcr/CflA family drug resistance efflux transporter, partial [Pseudomonadota bacterium]
YFAMSAASIGLASLLNAKLVIGLGMRRLTGIALTCLTLVSLVFWAFLPVFSGVPPLWLFIAWQLAAFFCVGIIFGNLNALSLEPLGHMAGLGAAFVGAMATFMCLPLAWIVASRFDGTVYALVAGFALLGLATCGMMVWTERKNDPRP